MRLSRKMKNILGVCCAILPSIVSVCCAIALIREAGNALVLIVCLFIGASLGTIGMIFLALPQGATCENPGCMGSDDPGRGEFCQHCGDALHPLCPNCSIEIRQGQKYCAACGTLCGQIEEETVEESLFEENYPTVQMTCFHCGKRLYDYTGTCPHCGITDKTLTNKIP